METNLRIFKDPEELAIELADEITASLYYGGFAALAGGNSPLKTYSLLAERCNIPWERITFISTDERCYPTGHSGRNDTTLNKIFFRRPCRILDLYEELRKLKKPAQGDRGIEDLLPFNITILGLGDDGHMASLFPGNNALEKFAPIVNVSNAPKLPAQRISLSLPSLNRSKMICFCVVGISKKRALKDLLMGENIPPNMLCPEGSVHIFADRDAAGPDLHI